MARGLIVVDARDGLLRGGDLASERCLAAPPAIQRAGGEVQSFPLSHVSGILGATVES